MNKSFLSFLDYWLLSHVLLIHHPKGHAVFLPASLRADIAMSV
jgi:hypothetical protein